MLSEEYSVIHLECFRTLCEEINSSIPDDEKISHLMKRIAEDIYRTLLRKNFHYSRLYKIWQLYLGYEAEADWSTKVWKASKRRSGSSHR
ncbi:hypothetical protein NPIL_653631 [Nephila pilipes]|uniref:Uncharacterized protein n=1 Tax=Nephila pilipes TaxID=299642 RepID=A0A8X6QPW5_NEPPI|nr:hypothetical protein NPIL_653631 [Nephila pilipes]